MVRENHSYGALEECERNEGRRQEEEEEEENRDESSVEM